MIKNPRLYQINTRLWLKELAKQYQCSIGLTNIPDEQWRLLKDLGFDYVWLMGIWMPSPYSQRVARESEGLKADYAACLDDWVIEDVVSSPYAVADYNIHPEMGSFADLDNLRTQLHAHGLKLILDFVPNHTAVDHPWVHEHPEYYVQIHADQLQSGRYREGVDFMRNSSGVAICLGKDPNYAPWTDTAQLNYFNGKTRDAVVETIKEIAKHCDGIRCDMAMLVCTYVFKDTWKELVPEIGDLSDDLKSEFWTQAIPVLKATYPDFLLIAEVYWDLESLLHEQGFDYCYDKKLYNLLEVNKIAELKDYLHADTAYQQKMTRFLENHDEARAVTKFGREKSMAAAVLVTTIPGMTLIHHHQMDGFKSRVPVQLGRNPDEPVDNDIKKYYEKLLQLTKDEIYHQGRWQLLNTESLGHDNLSAHNLLAYRWDGVGDSRIIVINLSDHSAQGHVRFEMNVNDDQVLLLDQLNDQEYTRKVADLRDFGLYVDLQPFQAHILKVVLWYVW